MMFSADLVKDLAGAPNVGVFIDRAFDVFEEVFGATLVTFNVLDFATRNASVVKPLFRELGAGRLADSVAVPAIGLEPLSAEQ